MVSPISLLFDQGMVTLVPLHSTRYYMQSQCSLKVVLEWRRWVLVGAYELQVLLMTVNKCKLFRFVFCLQDRYILSR